MFVVTTVMFSLTLLSLGQFDKQSKQGALGSRVDLGKIPVNLLGFENYSNDIGDFYFP
jgi:hypothetical protein